MTLSGDFEKVLNNLLVNNGVIQQADAGSLVVSGANTLVNQATGIYDFASDAGITGGGVVTNKGTLRKSAGTGVTTVTAILNMDHGVVEALSGWLNLGGAGLWQQVTLNAAAGAILEASGGPAITGVFTGSGAGKFEFSGGFVPCDAGIAGATATLNFPTELAFWVGGEMGTTAGSPALGNTIPVTNAGYLTIAGSGSKSIRNNTLINTGTLIDAGSGDLVLNGMGDGAASTIDNRAGATFEMRGDFRIVQTQTNPGNILNAGSFLKTAGTGAAQVGEHFTNLPTGLLKVQSGQLQLQGGSAAGDLNNTGTVHIGSGSVITGAFAQSTGGTLEIEIAGTSASNTWSPNVTGQATRARWTSSGPPACADAG